VLALLFPGQGSQEVGMGRDVFEASEAAREVFASADAALGFALSTLCFEGPQDTLVSTEIQQPAILATSIALYRCLQEHVPELAPAFVAGHSLGEYSALVAAGALDLPDAVRLVHARGRFMQQAVPDGAGAMAAVLGASPDDVAKACEEAGRETGEVVTPANYNSPQQTVIAGTAKAVALACERASQLGAKRSIPLKVSAPFHCALMAPAARQLAVQMKTLSFRDARPPVVTNVEAEPNVAGSRVAGLLERQVTAPVRFTEMVEKLASLGVDRFLEVGPGRVLTGLVARIARRSMRASFGGLGDLDEVRVLLGISAGSPRPSAGD
jgi:[acyl-carrier-protein] S-malonyltransferase